MASDGSELRSRPRSRAESGVTNGRKVPFCVELVASDALPLSLKVFSSSSVEGAGVTGFVFMLKEESQIVTHVRQKAVFVISTTR